LRGYEQAWLRWDILAGLTVAAYAVPQLMAYGVLAGLPPVAGLWAAIPSLALYAFIGSELPRVFRTGKLRLIHAASCPFRYSSKTSCGVRYPSVEWRRVLL
jgi:hypothetical protein